MCWTNPVFTGLLYKLLLLKTNKLRNNYVLICCELLINLSQQSSLDISIKKFQIQKKINLGMKIWIRLSSVQFFFAETGQATPHQCEIILHAVWKVGTWVLTGSFSFRSEGESALLAKREGGNYIPIAVHLEANSLKELTYISKTNVHVCACW